MPGAALVGLSLLLTPYASCVPSCGQVSRPRQHIGFFLSRSSSLAQRYCWERVRCSSRTGRRIQYADCGRVICR